MAQRVRVPEVRIRCIASSTRGDRCTRVATSVVKLEFPRPAHGHVKLEMCGLHVAQYLERPGARISELATL